MVLLRRPGFLITEDAGTHEFTRVYVNSAGQVRAGERNDGRIGPGTITGVYLDLSGDGLKVETTRGTCWVPVADCYATLTP